MKIAWFQKLKVRKPEPFISLATMICGQDLAFLAILYLKVYPLW